MFRYYGPKSQEILNCEVKNTIKPVYTGPVLRSHSLLGRQFSNSRFFAQTNAVFGSHLYLSAAATLQQSSSSLSLLFLPVLSGHP